jgi:Fe-S cluster assembly iron-binding protein IscA
LALDEPKETDEKFEFDGLTVIIEKELLGKTGGVCVDFVEQGFFRGYRVDPKTPLAKGGGKECGDCSCG